MMLFESASRRATTIFLATNMLPTRRVSIFRTMLCLVAFLVQVQDSVDAFVIASPTCTSVLSTGRSFNQLHVSTSTDDEISFDSLMDMDIVIYSNKNDESETKLFGALQEDGSLAPLSAWTTDPAFGKSLELLVDEEDRFSLKAEQVRIHYLLNESEMSYGSRQCHRGVGNPHGEESELLYYVEQSVVEKFDVKLVIKPELEILW